MDDTNTCKVITDCVQFDLKNYSLNNGKTYSNPLVAFPVFCPGTTISKDVFIQPNTIRLTWPYQPNSPVPYPPIVLSCPAGGAIIKQIPQSSTQEEIDDIINGMIMQCAQAQAEANVVCQTQQYYNEVVYYDYECGAGFVLVFNGTLPAWITFDAANNRLIGAASTFTGETKDLANANAQSELNTFGDAQVAAGTLKCVTLNFCELVWVLRVPAHVSTPNGGVAIHSENCGVFSNTVIANGPVPGNSSYIETDGTMFYTGPAQNCQLVITVSGVSGAVDVLRQILVRHNGSDNRLNQIIPFAGGTYTYPFTIPASVVPTEILCSVLHDSTNVAPGGGCSWSGSFQVL